MLVCCSDPPRDRYGSSAAGPLRAESCRTVASTPIWKCEAHADNHDDTERTLSRPLADTRPRHVKCGARRRASRCRLVRSRPLASPGLLKECEARWSDFSIDPDIRVARTLPARIYSDPSAFEAQRDRVFARTWQYAAH